jgi:hypothetical protein
MIAAVVATVTSAFDHSNDCPASFIAIRSVSCAASECCACQGCNQRERHQHLVRDRDVRRRSNTARRDNEFIAQLACMLPGNIDEASLAAQYIFAQAQAADLLRLARETDDTDLIVKCSTLSNSMMRQANATRRLFMQLQAARQKREADPKTRDLAAWIEHAAISLMAAALDRLPPAPPLEPEPPPPEAPPHLEPEDKFRGMTPPEQYAALYPRRAAQIRAYRGLPPNCDFGPPPPELVHGIVHGSSTALLALDHPETAAAL